MVAFEKNKKKTNESKFVQGPANTGAAETNTSSKEK